MSAGLLLGATSPDTTHIGVGYLVFSASAVTVAHCSQHTEFHGAQTQSILIQAGWLCAAAIPGLGLL